MGAQHTISTQYRFAGGRLSGATQSRAKHRRLSPAADIGGTRGGVARGGRGGAILTKVTRVIIDRQNFMAETTPPPPPTNITLSVVWRLGGSVRGCAFSFSIYFSICCRTQRNAAGHWNVHDCTEPVTQNKQDVKLCHTTNNKDHPRPDVCSYCYCETSALVHTLPQIRRNQNNSGFCPGQIGCRVSRKTEEKSPVGVNSMKTCDPNTI